jgi:ferric-dicitrate binding protein FerR (iron transport regulator)
MEELLSKYFTDALTYEEKALMFRRLGWDDALKAEFARMQNIMAVSGMVADECDDRMSKDGFKAVMRRARMRATKRIALTVTKYAAVAAALFCAWFVSKDYIHINNKVEELTYMTIKAPKGQHVYVKLADGSEVWIGSRSQLQVPDRFNKGDRTVRLDGEGFFSVAKNADKPFIVETEKYSVEAIGTQFNVFAYTESTLFEADLTEGAVEVYRHGLQTRISNEDTRLRLAPNEKAYDHDGELRKAPSHFTKTATIKNGIYSFENRTLRDITAHLEVWYNVEIKITKPEMEAYCFSGKFRQTDDITQIMKAIKETGKFKSRIPSEKQIEIY